MRRWPFVSILISLALGFVAGLVANSMRSGVVLCVDEEHTSYHFQFSANGRYLASLATSLNANTSQNHLKLIDCQNGTLIGKITQVSSTTSHWACSDDGCLLAIKYVNEQGRDANSKVVSTTHYWLVRKKGDEDEKEVCRWNMTEWDADHQFAFSRDGNFLAHGRREKGKVWVEWINTSTGAIVQRFDIENAHILHYVTVLPRRNALLVVTSPPGKELNRSNFSTASFMVLDANTKVIEHRHEYQDIVVDHPPTITTDGEHLLVRLRNTQEPQLIDLTNGNRQSLPVIVSDEGGAKNQVKSQYFHLWPSIFGQSLFLISQPGISSNKESAYLLNWATNTSKEISYRQQNDLSAAPGCWIPGNEAIVLCVLTNQPHNPIVGWYHQLQRTWKWGSPPGAYLHLSVLDLTTMKRTHWLSLNHPRDHVQVISAPDGKQMLVALSDRGKGMRLELWENPLLPRFLPRGTFTGVVVTLVTFLLLRLLARWRKKPTPDCSHHAPS